MPHRMPLYVESWRDRHGIMRVYFRRGGKRIALPAKIGSAEFAEAYNAALSGVPLPRTKREGDPPGTIGALIASYLKSAAYVGLRETTKAGYASRLNAIRNAHGKRPLAGMTRERIVTHILQPYADRPGSALSILKMMRILIGHAIDIGWLKHDPSTRIKRPKTQEIRSWTDEEIAQFEGRWQPGTKQRTAFALMLYTGQRRSDVHRMTWADVRPPRIKVVQQKTGEKLSIYLHKDLRHVLAAAERSHMTILNTAYGKPFTVDGFGQWLRDAIREAGLPLECQPHGLRKAAGRRLAEAGCSAKQIMAVLGHRTMEQAEVYTRDADQARLADAAILRLEGMDLSDEP